MRALLSFLLTGRVGRRRGVVWTVDQRRATLEAYDRRLAGPPLTDAELRNFDQAFGGGGSGCRGRCECGMEFYNSDGGWDWEQGELEHLHDLAKQGKARDLEWGVGYVVFEGRHYVWDCECWRPRAAKVAGWLRAHAAEIAEFLTLEKRRLQKEADQAPTVREVA